VQLAPLLSLQLAYLAGFLHFDVQQVHSVAVAKFAAAVAIAMDLAALPAHASYLLVVLQ